MTGDAKYASSVIVFSRTPEALVALLALEPPILLSPPWPGSPIT